MQNVSIHVKPHFEIYESRSTDKTLERYLFISLPLLSRSLKIKKTFHLKTTEQKVWNLFPALRLMGGKEMSFCTLLCASTVLSGTRWSIFDPHYNLWRRKFMISFYKLKNWGMERLSSLLNVTELVGRKSVLGKLYQKETLALKNTSHLSQLFFIHCSGKIKMSSIT